MERRSDSETSTSAKTGKSTKLVLRWCKASVQNLSEPPLPPPASGPLPPAMAPAITKQTDDVNRKAAALSGAAFSPLQKIETPVAFGVHNHKVVCPACLRRPCFPLVAFLLLGAQNKAAETGVGRLCGLRRLRQAVPGGRTRQTGRVYLLAAAARPPVHRDRGCTKTDHYCIAKCSKKALAMARNPTVDAMGDPRCAQIRNCWRKEGDD